MRKIILTIAIVIFVVCPVRAVTIWDSGHHTVNDGDVYGELFLVNDATADIFGGVIAKLETHVTGTANIWGGEMDTLLTHDDSVVNIYGGTLDWFGAWDESVAYLYAYGTTYHIDGGINNQPWLEGKYLDTNISFSFTLYDEYSYSHVNIVPEPATLLLFTIGGLFLRRNRK